MFSHKKQSKLHRIAMNFDNSIQKNFSTTLVSGKSHPHDPGKIRYRTAHCKEQNTKYCNNQKNTVIYHPYMTL